MIRDPMREPAAGDPARIEAALVALRGGMVRAALERRYSRAAMYRWTGFALAAGVALGYALHPAMASALVYWFGG